MRRHVREYWRYWCAGIIGASCALIVVWIFVLISPRHYLIGISVGWLVQLVVNVGLLKFWAMPERHYPRLAVLKFGTLLLSNLLVRLSGVATLVQVFNWSPVWALACLLPVLGISSWYITTTYIFKESS